LAQFTCALWLLSIDSAQTMEEWCLISGTKRRAKAGKPQSVPFRRIPSDSWRATWRHSAPAFGDARSHRWWSRRPSPAAKMANSIEDSSALHRTYAPPTTWPSRTSMKLDCAVGTKFDPDARSVLSNCRRARSHLAAGAWWARSRSASRARHAVHPHVVPSNSATARIAEGVVVVNKAEIELGPRTKP